jgi:hypothetical protein
MGPKTVSKMCPKTVCKKCVKSVFPGCAKSVQKVVKNPVEKCEIRVFGGWGLKIVPELAKNEGGGV